MTALMTCTWIINGCWYEYGQHYEHAFKDKLYTQKILIKKRT